MATMMQRAFFLEEPKNGMEVHIRLPPEVLSPGTDGTHQGQRGREDEQYGEINGFLVVGGVP